MASQKDSILVWADGALLGIQSTLTAHGDGFGNQDNPSNVPSSSGGDSDLLAPDPPGSTESQH